MVANERASKVRIDLGGSVDCIEVIGSEHIENGKAARPGRLVNCSRLGVVRHGGTLGVAQNSVFGVEVAKVVQIVGAKFGSGAVGLKNRALGADRVCGV